MTENSVLVAIEAALQSPGFCACGDTLDLAAHDDALWLECRAFTRPSRLPAPVISFLREGFHDRRHVADLPAEDPAADPARASRGPRAARSAPSGA